MLVGLDLLYLTPGETGGRESYARELVPAMLELEPQLELVAFVNRDAGPRLAAELGREVRAVVVPVSARRRAQWALGEVALVSAAAARRKVQILHSMANFSPAWGPFRRVVTIHDMQYQALPELLSWPMRAGTGALISTAAPRAHRIIAVSQAGREEIVAGLNVHPSRVDVVPNGVRPAPPPPLTDGARRWVQLGQRPSILCVASNLPHKNLRALIDALALVPSARRPLALMAGYDTDAGDLSELAAALGVGDDVRLLGHCTTEQLESLYGLADCLVLPTLHEGFGLPVLEAMARSLPVLCSDIPALREVAGDAALYFDPRSSAQIAARIEQLMSGEAPVTSLRDRGCAQAARFSWAAAAEGTLASYRRALNRGGAGLYQ